MTTAVQDCTASPELSLNNVGLGRAIGRKVEAVKEHRKKSSSPIGKVSFREGSVTAAARGIAKE
jgi:hypothetical protein